MKVESSDLNCLFVQSEQLSDLHSTKLFSPNTMHALINFIVNFLLCPTTFMCKLIIVIKMTRNYKHVQYVCSGCEMK